jgi:uncharacterized protein
MILLSIIDKPTIVFDRTREWNELERFATSSTARLGVVYGRRRLGKTHLVEHFANAVNGLYFCAAQQSSEANLADLGQAVQEWIGSRSPVRYNSWDEALRHILHVEVAQDQSVAVIDEVGYLIEGTPSFPSLLQRALDRRPRPSVPLILSGSTQAVMKNLTASGQPLRGRANLEMTIGPFDFRTTAAFWNVASARAAILLWSVVGGTPGYRELCNDEAPGSELGFPKWLERYLLSPSAALHREGRVVVAEEVANSDPASHWAVLAAITSGHTSRDAIAHATGRPSTALANSLTTLVGSGLIARHDDPLHGRRSSYRVAEPVITAWKELVEPIERRVLRTDVATLFNDIEAPLHARVVGPAYEQLVVDWAMDFASEATLGGRPSAVGSSVLGRSYTEGAQIDLVAISRETSGQRRVLAIGEAKHRIRPIGIGELRRLEGIRLRIGSETESHEIKLVLACDAGFDRELSRIARSRSDIELVDADRLLSGN